MVNNENIDISEYNRLKDENATLRTILRRYLIFGEYGKFNNLESDLSDQLHYAENLNAKLFDNSLAATFAGDIVFENNQPVDFIYTKINPSFAFFAQMAPESIIGRKASRIKTLSPTTWMPFLAKVNESANQCSGTIHDQKNSYEVSAFATKPGSFIATFQNTKLHAEAESQIRQSLSLTQTMLDALPTPVFCKDMEGRYTLCNKSYATNVLGVSPDTIIGKTALQLENFFPKEYADFYQEKDIQLIKDKGIQIYQGPIKCADGTVREFIVNKTLIKNSEGEFAGILGVMQDIDRMIKARRELVESETRYKTLFNGIRQPIIVVDTEGNIIMLNSTAVELFEEDEKHISPNDNIPATQLIDLNIIREISKTGITQTRKTCITVKGEERWYMSTMQPINDFFGEKVIQIIAHDITEIKHYQTELLGQKKKAEESNRLKSVFLANIAHETRTPVNIITGFVQMIQSGMAADKHKDYLNLINTNCKKLLAIIDDIVELSMIETGQKKLRHEMCSINGIVEESALFLQQLISESGKDIIPEKSKPTDDLESLVFTDSMCISQIFKKLITNAVTFTNQGKIIVGAYITPKTPESPSQIAFFISDTGIGIAKEKISVIFERFRQGDEGAARQYGGNGLGLSIANELVKQMGGRIEVQSTENVGSTFTFYIPYQKAGLSQSKNLLK